MGRFILRRLLIIPPALLLINFLAYTYGYLVAPVQASTNPYSTMQTNLPSIWSGYGQYLTSLAHFDLGVNPVDQQPLGQQLLQASLASLGLLSIALFFSILLGVLLGFLAVKSDPPRIAGWLTALVSIGLASSSLFVGAILIAASIYYMFWSPAGVLFFPIVGYGWDIHLVLPVLALMVRPTAQIAQVTASLMFDELGKQYVIAARSFGNSWSLIRQRHVMRNILAGVILAISSSLRFLMAELVIVERLVSWPGIGRLLALALVSTMNSAMFLDPTVLAALVTLMAALFLLVEMVVSTLVRTVDPRLRAAQ